MALPDGGSEFRFRRHSCALTKTDDVERASQSSGGASTKKSKFLLQLLSGWCQAFSRWRWPKRF
jgi:hypothetical protein